MMRVGTDGEAAERSLSVGEAYRRMRSCGLWRKRVRNLQCIIEPFPGWQNVGGEPMLGLSGYQKGGGLSRVFSERSPL
jgi:hypothetical protein